MRVSFLVFLILGIALISSFLIRPLIRFQRRRTLRTKAFPIEWRKILKHNLPLYNHLPSELKKELHNHIQIFLAEKNFEGCGGLEVTDEMRVTIAAQACILLLGRKADYFPKLVSILVYPGAFKEKKSLLFKSLNADLDQRPRLGESWTSGMVILAWDHVRHGARDLRDGQNVVFHEFAHQLDQEGGTADGMPPLEERTQHTTWARVLEKEYRRLQRRAAGGRRTLIDEYGATHPAEFFAVASECFFERAKLLREKRPELYEELKGFYKVDPAEWD